MRRWCPVASWGSSVGFPLDSRHFAGGFCFSLEYMHSTVGVPAMWQSTRGADRVHWGDSHHSMARGPRRPTRSPVDRRVSVSEPVVSPCDRDFHTIQRGIPRGCARKGVRNLFTDENHVHHGLMSAGAQRCDCLLRRLDVLVHAEQVRRVVPLLHLRETAVVPPVRRSNAIVPLVHHEVYVRAAGGVRV